MAALALTSCYHEKDITAEIGEPQYVIEDSDDPVDHFRYEFYQNYGVYILYDYSELDYRWNLNNPDLLEDDDCNFIRQKDKAALSLGIDYLEKTLFQFYDDGFKQKYFPIKILLADTIINWAYGGSKDEIVYTGRNYIAFGQIRKDLEKLTDEQLKERRGIIHGKLWANNIYSNGLIEIPQEFFEPGLEYYGKTIGVDADPRAFGFWIGKKSGNATMAPSQSEDVESFFRMITSHTQAEMEAEMADYELLKNKYEILLNCLNTKYQIDLQSIGNQ